MWRRERTNKVDALLLPFPIGLMEKVSNQGNTTTNGVAGSWC